MQSLEDYRSSTRSQSAIGVCSTCLSADRALFSLQNKPQLINICNGINLSMADMICYECRALLGNFVKFRTRALRAERLLACVPSSCHLPETKILEIFSTSGIKSLSTLTQTVIMPHNTIYVDGDLTRVKVEADSETDVKAETLELTVGPLSVPMKKTLETEVKQNGDNNSTTKYEPADDDMESDSGSEDVEAQIEDPLITMHFTAKPMELSEVLSHMEKTRNTTRFKRAQYKCDKCALVFTTELHYKTHSKRHSGKRGSFKCEVCKQRYKNNSKALKRHTARHYTRYACRHCPRSCFGYSQMYFHYRNVHDESTPRQCSKCPASFKNYRELLQHKHRAHGRKYPCLSCDRQYATSVGLWRHRLVHDDTVPELECEICHKKYKGEPNLKKHIRDVHETDPGAYCTECDLQFKTTNQYRQHLNTSKHVPSAEYRFECDYCGKKFTQKPTLNQHIEVIHLKLSKYKCEYCDETFHTKRYAANHARKKHSEPKGKKFVCHICAKAFAIRKSLNEHMNGHLGVRPFECKLCGANFAYNSALYHHNQLVHLKKARKGRCT